MAPIFHAGSELIVITRGEGELVLLSWQNNARGADTVGAIPTTNKGITRYLVSFSHHYERFAFIWSGQGEAVYQIGNNLERKPVGRNWGDASTVNWGANEVTRSNVSNLVGNAVKRDSVTTAFVIPDNV